MMVSNKSYIQNRFSDEISSVVMTSTEGITDWEGAGRFWGGGWLLQQKVTKLYTCLRLAHLRQYTPLIPQLEKKICLPNTHPTLGSYYSAGTLFRTSLTSRLHGPGERSQFSFGICCFFLLSSITTSPNFHLYQFLHWENGIWENDMFFSYPIIKIR